MTTSAPLPDANEDAEFKVWVATLPDKHWAKYDISACRLGWNEGRKALRERCERKCTWSPLRDSIDAFEGCASIHHVGRDSAGPTLPAYCEDCGGAVVVTATCSAGDTPT